MTEAGRVREVTRLPGSVKRSSTSDEPAGFSTRAQMSPSRSQVSTLAPGALQVSVTPESDLGISLIWVVDGDKPTPAKAPLESVTKRLPSHRVSPSSGLPAASTTSGPTPV